MSYISKKIEVILNKPIIIKAMEYHPLDYQLWGVMHEKYWKITRPWQLKSLKHIRNEMGGCKSSGANCYITPVNSELSIIVTSWL